MRKVRVKQSQNNGKYYHTPFNKVKMYSCKVTTDRETAKESKKLTKILLQLNTLFFNIISIVGCYTFEFNSNQLSQFKSLQENIYERITFILFRYSGSNPEFYVSIIFWIAIKISDVIVFAKQIRKIAYHPDSEKLDMYQSALNEQLNQLRYITGVSLSDKIDINNIVENQFKIIKSKSA